MHSCLICGYKAEYIQEYVGQEDIDNCLCGTCLNDMDQEKMVGPYSLPQKN